MVKRLSVIAIIALAGCASALDQYAPMHAARGELILRYPATLQIHAGNTLLTQAPTFEGLTDYVACVPEALSHAEEAEQKGLGAVALSWLGGGLAVASLGSLGGLAVFDRDPALSLGILGGGLAVALVGIGLAATSRVQEIDAHGHAVDAVNYYNDAVGAVGRTCSD